MNVSPSQPGNVDAAAELQRLIANISRAVLGKEAAVSQAVLALISGGHLLLEDAPGLGKTLLAKALAKSMGADGTLEYGASPRGSLDFQAFSQARALLQGRSYVLPDDIKESARLVLPHRLITRKVTRSVAVDARTVIDHIVDAIPVPL